LLTLILLPLHVLFAGQRITGTITEVKDADNNRFVFLDINDLTCRNQVVSTLSARSDILCYSQKNHPESSTGPILVRKRYGGLLYHDDFGRDLGLGAALCIGGCLFVYLVGEEGGPAEDGVYASAGSKTVTGPLACIAGGMYITGCIFLVKGFIEIFIEDEGHSYSKSDELKGTIGRNGIAKKIGVSIPDAGTISSSTRFPERSTEEIIREENYTVVNKLEKTVSAGDTATMEKWIQRYCLSL
jgi:hypothetical protein